MTLIFANNNINQINDLFEAIELQNNLEKIDIVFAGNRLEEIKIR